jgi:outer membrane lipopolysaccharide assembly protein LptE/RlpB
MKHLGAMKTVTIALTLLLGLTACGYHLKGAGLKAPEGVETVAVTVLENRTSESGIEMTFTNDLTYEFTRSKVVRVVDEKTADAVLSGTITSLGTETISYTTNYDSDERRVRVTLNLNLKSRHGKVLWSDPALAGIEEFKVADDKFVTDRNRREAIEIISERIAERVHNRILQDF